MRVLLPALSHAGMNGMGSTAGPVSSYAELPATAGWHCWQTGSRSG